MWAILLALALAAVPEWMSAEGEPPSSEATAQQIEECVRGNFPDDSMIQEVRMVSVDRTGFERVLEAELYWLRDPEDGLSDVRLTFDSPPDLRGVSVLLLENESRNDMFAYLPELGKTRRITADMVRGKVMGTDFTYEDFEQLQGMLESLESRRLEDDVVDGRSVFVTESRPNVGSEYSRIVSKADQETCVPLAVELFEHGHDGPAKRLTADPNAVKEETCGFMPREVEMKDLRQGTSTTITVEKLEAGVPIARSEFSIPKIERLGRSKGGTLR
jgi:hypothetical protein